MKTILFSLLLTLSYFSTFAITRTVTNKNYDGVGSLRYILTQELNNNDTVRFDPNLIANGSDTLFVDTVIKFNKNVTIIGLYNSSDTLYISGKNTSSIFDIQPAYSATVKMLTFDSLVLIDSRDSALPSSGIHIWEADTVRISNCIFRNHIGRHSGAVFALADLMYIDNCEFSNNDIFLDTIGCGSVYQSAMLAPANKHIFLRVTNSIFKDNSGYNGGAIHMYNNVANTKLQLEISNCRFTQNHANNDGGALYLQNEKDSSLININYTTFDHNLSDGYGGAIYTQANMKANIVDITTTTIFSNTSSQSGGAIYSVTPPSQPTIYNLSNNTITANQSANTAYHGVYSNGNTTYTLQSNLIYFNGAVINPTYDLNTDIKVHPYNSENIIVNSNGYNVIRQLSNALNSDRPYIQNPTVLKLDTLSHFNGSKVPSLMPLKGSILINNGNPNDTTDAQNGKIVGTRDIGAAEKYTFTQGDVIVCDSITLGTHTYYNSQTILDTLYSNEGRDSIVYLNLDFHEINTATTVQDSVITALANNVTYQWYNCDSNSIIVGANQATFTPINNGNYAVLITDSVCSKMSDCVMITAIVNNVNVYPNPTNGDVNIFFNNWQQGDQYQIQVFNNQGGLIYNIATVANYIQIPCANWSAGLYTIKLLKNNTVEKITKFMKL